MFTPGFRSKLYGLVTFGQNLRNRMNALCLFLVRPYRVRKRSGNQRRRLWRRRPVQAAAAAAVKGENNLLITSQLSTAASAIIPQRFPKNHDTHILIQIRGAFTVTIGSELGEVTNPSDGAQYTQANTSPPARVRWRGDLWHTASVAGSQWVLIIAAEEKQQECGD